MAIDPSEIGLTHEQRELLARLAEQNGMSWQETLRTALAKLEVPNDELSLDDEYRALFCAENETQAPVSLEQVRSILSKCSGSLSESIIEDRQERF